MFNTKNTIVAICALLLPFSAISADKAGNYDADDYYEVSPQNSGISDPIEGFNRGMSEFNSVVDTILLDPLAEGYDYILPQFAQNRVFHFLENLEAPVVFANSLMQADAQNSFVTFWRFLFNSTLGVAGLFDMATELGMPPRNHEDFGQTLGVWGVGHGGYLVLPIFGPSSFRDAPGKVVDMIINPLSYAVTIKPLERVAISLTGAVDTRNRFDSFIERTNETSLDPYATFRSLYLQRRQAQLVNANDSAFTATK